MPTAREATTRLVDLLRPEHHALAEFLVALSVFDREQQWIELGYSSLFYFLTRELGLSKGSGSEPVAAWARSGVKRGSSRSRGSESATSGAWGVAASDRAAQAAPPRVTTHEVCMASARSGD